MTTTARSLLRALLIENMADCSTVDGHDLGSGEMNIFILTDDPHAPFAYA